MEAIEYLKFPETPKPLMEIWEEHNVDAQILNEAFNDRRVEPFEVFSENNDKFLSNLSEGRLDILLKILPERIIITFDEIINGHFEGRLSLVGELRKADMLLEMAILKSKMWPQLHDIKVCFIGGDDANKVKVMQYASEWSNYCGITFSQTDDINGSDIRVAFTVTGHWSYLGNDALLIPKTNATVNFELRDLTDERDYRKVVLHEFGHVLGLIHEHQSPMANFTWDKPAIYRAMLANYGWGQAQVDVNFFDTYEKERKMYSPLDPLSIMGYDFPAYFTNHGVAFPRNYDLSATDKQYIGKLYPKLLHS